MELKELTERGGVVFDACRALATENKVFLQDFEWGDFQSYLGKRVRHFFIADEQGAIRLFAQVIEQAASGQRYVFAPYGPIFPLHASDDEKREAFNIFIEHVYALCNGLVFTRFESENDLYASEGGAIPLSDEFQQRMLKSADLDPHQTLVLDLHQDIETLLAQMKPKTRYNIRLAEKSGVEVKILDQLPVGHAGNEGAITQDPITASAERAGIRGYTRSYLNDLLKFFAENGSYINARCYAAYHEGDLLAANIMIEYAGQSTYLFGGAIDLKRNLMPSYLLHFQAIQDAKARGVETYDFWGVETDENHPWYGFSKFKLGFGGRVVTRPGTYDFVYSHAWYNGYTLLRKLNRMVKSLYSRADRSE